METNVNPTKEAAENLGKVEAQNAKPEKKSAVAPILGKIAASALGYLADLLANQFKGALTPYNEAGKKAVKAAVIKVDGGMDKLLEAAKNYEAENPVVKQAFVEAKTVLAALGLTVIDADVLELHIKEAIYDLASDYVPDLPKPENALEAA